MRETLIDLKDVCFNLCDSQIPIYISACDFMGLLMCAMSVQDILAEKPDGGMKLIPMCHLWKLYCSYLICIMRCMNVSLCIQ